MWKRLNRWGRAAVESCAVYLLRNVITSAAVLPSPQRCRRRYSCVGGLGFLAWGSRIDSGMGRRPCKAGSHALAHRHLVDGALSRPGDVCVGTGAFVPGRGPGGPWAERRRWGKGG